MVTAKSQGDRTVACCCDDYNKEDGDGSIAPREGRRERAGREREKGGVPPIAVCRGIDVGIAAGTGNCREGMPFLES